MLDCRLASSEAWIKRNSRSFKSMIDFFETLLEEVVENGWEDSENGFPRHVWGHHCIVVPEAGNGKSMYLYRCPAKLQKADFAGFQKDGMCVLRQTQNKSFRILDLLSPCWFQSFPAIFQENSTRRSTPQTWSSSPSNGWQHHRKLSWRSCRPPNPKSKSHRQENTDLPELPGPSSLLRRLRQLQLNNLQKNIDDSYDAFDPIPSCSYNSLQSDNPPSGAHSQTSGEHHAAKRLLPQQKMRHDETRPKQAASKPWKHYLEIHY